MVAAPLIQGDSLPKVETLTLQIQQPIIIASADPNQLPAFVPERRKPVSFSLRKCDVFPDHRALEPLREAPMPFPTDSTATR